MEVIELHQIERGSLIYEDVQVGDPDTVLTTVKGPIVFDHLDGMYSYCYLQRDHDKVIHLYRFTPLVKYKDGYKIAKETDDGRNESDNGDPADGEGSNDIPADRKRDVAKGPSEKVRT